MALKDSKHQQDRFYPLSLWPILLTFSPTECWIRAKKIFEVCSHQGWRYLKLILNLSSDALFFLRIQ